MYTHFITYYNIIEVEHSVGGDGRKECSLPYSVILWMNLFSFNQI